MRKSILIITPLLSIFLLVASCYGQGSAQQTNDTAQVAEYVVETFEDAKGNLWFGTMNKGVARYDGRTLTYFTEKDGLCGNTVVSMAKDKEGNLWFGTHTGVCKYDGKTFTELSGMEGFVRSDREGNIWVCINTSVVRYNGNTFSEFDIPIVQADILSYSISPGRVSMYLQDSKGNLWFGTDGYGAFKFDGTSFTHFTKKDGLCSNTVMGIMEDAKGRIWFSCIQSFQPAMTGDGGVCRYDGNTFTKFPEVEGLSGNDIYTMYEERSGSIWIGATGLGAYRYNGETFTLFDQTDRKDLTVNFGVQGILEDHNGTLWFGFSGGLFRFNGTSFINVTQGGPWSSL